MIDINITLGTVIYPSALQYLDEFMQCMCRQSYKEFTLLIINDGVRQCELEKIMDNYLQIKMKVICYDKKYTPAELRTNLIFEAKHIGTDILIICDADDLFSDDRVEKVVNIANMHKDAAFFYNELKTFENTSVMPVLPLLTDCISCVLDYNYLGMSNTAIRLDCISDEWIESLFEFKGSIYDWYLYSRLIIFGGIGVFIPEAVTYYRFYDHNILGNVTESVENIDREIKVKIAHYSILKKYSKEMCTRHQEYLSGHYSILPKAGLNYWWNYTKGGELNEVS